MQIHSDLSPWRLAQLQSRVQKIVTQTTGAPIVVCPTEHSNSLSQIQLELQEWSAARDSPTCGGLHPVEWVTLDEWWPTAPTTTPTPAPSPSPDPTQGVNRGIKRGNRSALAEERRWGKRIAARVESMINAAVGEEAASIIQKKYQRQQKEVQQKQPLPVGILKQH